VHFARLYEKSALEDVCSQLIALLDSDPEEEEVQVFIKNNPVLLCFFAPERIFYKSPILSKYKTDITILNQRHELLLIELEKPGKRILKEDGGVAAPMQHALDQVRSWLHAIDEHRAAALDCLELKPSDVSMIRTAVIMGRDKDYNSEHLRRLKATDLGRRIEFLTYDDLLQGVLSVVRSFNET
jgi:hypothetical protein